MAKVIRFAIEIVPKKPLTVAEAQRQAEGCQGASSKKAGECVGLK